jgi:ParB family transcriptional regulator, chromosome partitioning protein
MSAVPGRWQPKLLSPEARRMAEAAARQAGLSLALWLARTIRQASSAEHVPPRASVSGAAAKALTLLAETLQPGSAPPLDEARAYLRLMTEFRLSIGEIAAGVGRPRKHVVRALRLLALPQNVRQLIEQRALSADHAYALTDADDPERLAQAVLALGLAADEARARAEKERG